MPGAAVAPEPEVLQSVEEYASPFCLFALGPLTFAQKLPLIASQAEPRTLELASGSLPNSLQGLPIGMGPA